jgi:cyanophycin synthetase
MRTRAIRTVEQRFLPGPSLWSGKSCLGSVVDMGPLAHASTSDHPGLADKLLSLFPAMHDFAEPLRRGAFLAEVLGRMAMELQRMAGAAPGWRAAATVQGRNGHVKIVIAAQAERLAAHAFDTAAALLVELCKSNKVSRRVRSAAMEMATPARQAVPARIAAVPHGLHMPAAHVMQQALKERALAAGQR